MPLMPMYKITYSVIGVKKASKSYIFPSISSFDIQWLGYRKLLGYSKGIRISLVHQVLSTGMLKRY